MGGAGIAQSVARGSSELGLPSPESWKARGWEFEPPTRRHCCYPVGPWASPSTLALQGAVRRWRRETLEEGRRPAVRVRKTISSVYIVHWLIKSYGSVLL